MKKLLSIVICAALFLSLTGCGSDSPFTDEQKQIQTALEDSISLTWMGDVRNDVTELWRLSECVTSDDITAYALDYYRAYFTSDDEIHAIINFGLNTTNKLSVFGESLMIDVYDYVSGEEHDTATLFGGALIQSYIININSGEVQ